MAETATNGKLANGKLWISVMPYVVSALVGIASAYGTSRATNTALQAEVENLKRDNVEIHKQLDYFRDNYASHSEMKYYMDGQTQILRSIQDDVREIRKNR